MKLIFLLDGGIGTVTEVTEKYIFYNYKGEECGASRELVEDAEKGNYKQIREGGEEVDAVLTVRRVDGMQYQILATSDNEVVRQLLKNKTLRRTKKGVVTAKNNMFNYAISDRTITELDGLKIEWRIDYLLY